jgi:hypothetical protein
MNDRGNDVHKVLLYESFVSGSFGYNIYSATLTTGKFRMAIMIFNIGVLEVQFSQILSVKKVRFLFKKGVTIFYETRSGIYRTFTFYSREVDKWIENFERQGIKIDV